jgi:hypothetical protein
MQQQLRTQTFAFEDALLSARAQPLVFALSASASLSGLQYGICDSFPNSPGTQR